MTNSSAFVFFRVLKPPGGGSSDIFGGSLPSTPRTVRNNMASNIFGASSDLKNGNGNGKWAYSNAYIFFFFSLKEYRRKSVSFLNLN